MLLEKQKTRMDAEIVETSNHLERQRTLLAGQQKVRNGFIGNYIFI